MPVLVQTIRARNSEAQPPALQRFITDSITVSSGANRTHIRMHGQFCSASSKSPVLLRFITDSFTVAHPTPARHPKVQLSNVLLPTQLQWVIPHAIHQNFPSQVQPSSSPLPPHSHSPSFEPHSSVTACMINQFSKWSSNLQKRDF